MKLGRWFAQKTRRIAGDATSNSPRLAESRLVVLDVDVTGTDPLRDHATGIAILPVEFGEFSLADIVYFPLNSERSGDHPDWQENYRRLTASLAERPVVTYNARFVKHMIKRAAELHHLPLPYSTWIDIASAFHGAFGDASNENASLLLWQQRMNVQSLREHDAVADVFVLAQMLQILIAYCEDVGIATFEALQRAQDARSWLRG